MFSIYGVEGRVFHNTLEELYKVNPAQNSNALLRSKSEMFDTEVNQFAQQTSRHAPNQSSLDAYRNQININPKEELNHAYEIMQESFSALNEGLSAQQALNQLRDSGANALPVINENNRIVGLFSYATLVNTLLENELGLAAVKSTPVKNYLSEQVITAEPITSIRRVAQVMDHYGLETVPVVDAFDALVGIITTQDLARAVAKEPPLSIWT